MVGLEAMENGGLTSLDPERIRCMHHVLNTIGDALESGSIDALEAVTQAVELMEDESLFNAGIGSVLDEDGTVTMDASIMNGTDGAAGSVVNVRQIRHPIRAANYILKQGWPVMLNSEAADKFAIQNGVEKVEPVWLITELRQKQWNLWKEQNARPGATDEDDSVLDHDLEGMGTVGAVALDRNGNVAAATSTGGMTGKPKDALVIHPSSVLEHGQIPTSLFRVQVLVKHSYEPVQHTDLQPSLRLD